MNKCINGIPCDVQPVLRISHTLCLQLSAVPVRPLMWQPLPCLVSDNWGICTKSHVVHNNMASLVRHAFNRALFKSTVSTLFRNNEAISFTAGKKAVMGIQVWILLSYTDPIQKLKWWQLIVIRPSLFIHSIIAGADSNTHFIYWRYWY